MNVFICHAAEQDQVAAELAVALRSRGHEVFLDEDDLPAGKSYDERIRRAVKKCSFFIFLISPQSVMPGRYALTELEFIKHRWPAPGDRVLPVMADKTEVQYIPAYLRSVTIFRPSGSLIAELLAEIDARRRWKPAKLALAALTVLAVFSLGILLIWIQAQRRTDNQPANAPGAYSAQAYCSRTGVVGTAAGWSTAQEAIEIAIEDCIDRGGVPACCKEGAHLAR